MRIIKLSWQSLQRHLLRFCLYGFTSILFAAVSVYIPYLTGNFIDMLIAPSGWQALLSFCLWLALLSIIKIVLEYCVNMLFAKVQIDATFSLSAHIVGHVHSVSINNIRRIDPVYFNQRVSQDAGSVISFSISTIIGILVNSLTLVSVILIMLSVSIKITLILAAFLALYAVLYLFFRKPLYKQGFAAKERQSIYFSKMSEQFSQAEFVKVHSLNDFFKKRLKDAFLPFRDTYIKLQRLSNLFSGLEGTILSIAQIALFVFGGYEIIIGAFTVGMFTVFSNLFGKLVQSANYFLYLGKSYQDSAISYDRLCEVLRWDTVQTGSHMPNSISNVVSRDLSFSYDGNRDVLDKLNIILETGKMYAVAGENGAGKSTFIQALIGLYRHEMAGDIFINGVSMRECDMYQLRKMKISVVEQEPPLLFDSIHNNLFLSDEHSDSDIQNVFELLGLNTFIDGLPNGLDTIISPQNNNLSGGEKQKIVIARALFKNPDLLILDEPTSALDQNTTQRLMGYLQRIKINKCIVIITHDVQIKNYCDETINLHGHDSA